MNPRLRWLTAGLALALLAQGAYSETASYGLRLGGAHWKDTALYGDGDYSESGAMFGPSLLFRPGNSERWAIGVEGLYGSLGDMDRVDADAIVMYEIASMFGIFADVRGMWYDYDLKNDPAWGKSLATTGLGAGLGVNVNVPLGRSGFFLFANTRVLPMRMNTDVPDKDGWAWLWSYEGGLAYAVTLDAIAKNANLYLAAGYRDQRLKNSDFAERLQLPFAELGVRQEF